MTHHTIPTIRWQDVIHSWSVPSLGIKTDATPGRINRAQGGVFLGAEVFLERSKKDHRMISQPPQTEESGSLDIGDALLNI